MVYSAKSAAVGTISQFTRRKKITITTGGTSTPASYQVKVTIAYEPEMQASFQDIRFNTKAGTYIDYWIESHTDSTTADVWLELPDAITDPGSDYIWMYYGNAGLSDGGVGADTFIQYAGYYISSSGAVVYKLANEVTEPFIYEANINWKTTDTQGGGVSDSNTYSLEYNGVYLFSGSNIVYRRNSLNSAISQAVFPSPMVGGAGYRKLKIVALTTGVTYSYTGTSSYGPETETGNNPSGVSMGMIFTLQGTTEGEIEYAFIRKYIANEPTPSYGTAQHQRRVPTFL